MTQTIELIPNRKTNSRPLFKTEEQYQKFRRSFTAEVRPDLEKSRIAREQSEEQAKHRRLR